MKKPASAGKFNSKQLCKSLAAAMNARNVHKK